ncbi:MAG: cation:proton antiporter [Prevotella sp.]|nr:cation:proton antiporter [Prevotella sp.]
MMQTELIPTTNTLSGINDTIAQISEAVTNPSLVNTVAEQISNSSSSRQIGLTIAIIGLLIFTAHLFSEIFSRKRIPDVLFLIIIGLLIGPVFHWISPESLGNAGSLFSGITLVTILFESGTQLRFSALKDSFKGALKLTALNFVFSAIAIWLVGWFVLELDPIVSMILGCMLGGTASAVVIPIVRQMHMSEKPAIMLILEAAIGNVFSIVLALALMQAVKSRHVEFGAILGDIFSSFILATVMGLFGAIFWALILDKVRNIKYSILTTPAFVFIIYGLNEWMGFSGAIAALAFGIGLANIDGIYNAWLKKFIKKVPVNLNETERSLFSELVLLLKTFFFIYVGISIQLNQWHPIVIGLGISVLLFIIRIPAVRFAISKREGIPDKELAFMSALNPKGLTAAVLATQALIYIPELETALFVRNIVFSVILFSIVINSILIPLIDREKGMYRFYIKMLSINQKMKNMVSKTKQDGEEWHKKHSRAHIIVDEMFQSEVISDIIKEQDQPGAVSNKPESNNWEVAD